MRAVYDAGCRYLQLDDTSLAYINDPAQREHIEAIGGDPDHLHEQYIANINRALAGRPDDLVVTTHMCRGNNQSMWVAEGGYDKVAEALFGDLEIDGYFMEWDDERSGTFDPLEYVPKGKTVVLGLVTTKRPELESKDSAQGAASRRPRRFVDVDQLCLSGQCGFSSTEEGNDLTIDEQFAKLRLIVETADEVWASGLRPGSPGRGSSERRPSRASSVLSGQRGGQRLGPQPVLRPHLADPRERLEHQPVGQRGVAGDVGGEFAGAGRGVVGELVREPERLALVGGQAAAGEHQRAQAVGAEQAPGADRRAAADEDPQPPLGQARRTPTAPATRTCVRHAARGRRRRRRRAAR